MKSALAKCHHKGIGRKYRIKSESDSKFKPIIENKCISAG